MQNVIKNPGLEQVLDVLTWLGDTGGANRVAVLTEPRNVPGEDDLDCPRWAAAHLRSSVRS